MDFKISVISGQPVWDALPVGKITDYPLEKRDYRPFAQARLCVNETDFFLRLWAFETRPSPKSVLMARLCFGPSGGKWLEIVADSFGGMRCEVVDGECRRNLAEFEILPHLHSYRGEDLEGEYWGVVVKLPRAAVKAVYGEDMLVPGYSFTGNLYKQDTAPESTHIGSLFPVDLSKEDPFGPASFGSFVLVNY